MKTTTALFVTFIALLAVICLVEAGGFPMPDAMPEELISEYNAIQAEVDKLPKNERGHPVFKELSPEVHKRLEQLRIDYEAQTGKHWPRPPAPPTASTN